MIIVCLTIVLPNGCSQNLKSHVSSNLYLGISVIFEGNREDFFSDLMSWARECGASTDGFTVANFGTEGYGLQSTKDIKVSSALVTL